MPFWNLEQHSENATALIDAQRTWSYAELAALADEHAARLPTNRRTLGFLSMPNAATAIAFYLGALRSGWHIPLLMQADMDAGLMQALVNHYHPDWIVLPSALATPTGYQRAHDDAELALHLSHFSHDSCALHADLGLLLSTSGSTGSSKLVRLSRAAISANAGAIASYLGLTEADRAITTLPLAYSFGMSILNSHLEVGASVVLTDESLVARGFWEVARTHGITSLSGVPATFEMLRRIGLERFELKHLRMLTQAGGRLRDALIVNFLDLSDRMGLQFFVMYGQTEAGPRISYVPPEQLRAKIGSVGVAIPGGELTLDADSSELIYRGPNVMLGYASTRDDLELGDSAQGILHTGDLAHRDSDGFFYLTGRVKRFVKISGNRVNLDEVEAMLSAELSRSVVCSGCDDDLVAFVPGMPQPDAGRVKQLIQQRYQLFPGHIRVRALDALPLLPSGKTDYSALRELCDDRRLP